jgi:protein-L-isoaspartate(D-aspartate) O-methyltransferase
MTDLERHRRFYAEEIQIAANLQSAAVVDALAQVARERFLPEGPWTIRSDADVQMPPRQTHDANPRHVYHNVAVAIDPSRTLFNGAPGVVARAIDALALKSGDRVLHLGTGLGYYTALAAHCVGGSGRVLGIEADHQLAARAAANLAIYPWIEVRAGNGTETFNESFDAILINAGVTHPLGAWLDALVPGARMVLPLTATMPGMGPIGKGWLVLLTKRDHDRVEARPLGFVAIYNALGVRDETMNARLGQAMATSPFAPIKSVRRDAHEQDSSCWLHVADCCFSVLPACERDAVEAPASSQGH